MKNIYKKLLKKDDYFKHWVQEDVLNLTVQAKEEIYLKYVMKIKVLGRDNYTCQNINGPGGGCKYCTNEPFYNNLTVHHFKAKRNGGQNKARNGVTLCQGSHNALNRGKMKIVYSNNPNLPAHIRGSIQTVDDFPQINWKELKKRMKERRKEVRHLFGIELTSRQITILMRWLELSFQEDL